LSYGLLLQALSAKQEQLWSVCTGFVGIALINPCGLGMLPCVICLQFLVSVSSLKEVYIQFYFNDNISGACIFAEIMNVQHAALIARADVP
jgi:hypothetical protein